MSCSLWVKIATTNCYFTICVPSTESDSHSRDLERALPHQNQIIHFRIRLKYHWEKSEKGTSSRLPSGAFLAVYNAQKIHTRDDDGWKRKSYLFFSQNFATSSPPFLNKNFSALSFLFSSCSNISFSSYNKIYHRIHKVHFMQMKGRSHVWCVFIVFSRFFPSFSPFASLFAGSFERWSRASTDSNSYIHTTMSTVEWFFSFLDDVLILKEQQQQQSDQNFLLCAAEKPKRKLNLMFC